MNSPIDDFNGWSCQLIAKNNTWSYARRKRRLARKQLNQYEADSTECTDGAEKQMESSTGNTDQQKQIQIVMQESVTKDPLLICNFFVEVIEHNEESENDNVKISMVFEKGNGGRNALETFKQYLINKLNVREYSKKQNVRPSKKKRKRLKKSKSDVHETNINLEEGESSSFENNVESS